MPYHVNHPKVGSIKVDSYDELSELLSNGLLSGGMEGAFGGLPTDPTDITGTTGDLGSDLEADLTADDQAELDSIISEELPKAPKYPGLSRAQAGAKESWRLAKAYAKRNGIGTMEARSILRVRRQKSKPGRRKAK